MLVREWEDEGIPVNFPCGLTILEEVGPGMADLLIFDHEGVGGLIDDVMSSP